MLSCGVCSVSLLLPLQTMSLSTRSRLTTVTSECYVSQTAVRDQPHQCSASDNRPLPVSQCGNVNFTQVRVAAIMNATALMPGNVIKPKGFSKSTFVLKSAFQS